MDFLHAFTQGSVVLAAVFSFLILMSFASWYVIFWKGMRLRFEYRAYQNFLKKYASSKDWPTHLQSHETEGGVKILLDEASNLQSILAHYKSCESRKEILAMHLTQSLDEIRFALDRGLTILASIGSSAPFIGLFGTVWGIYNALSNISTQGSAGLAVVAGPMGEALVATAIGLFAAIPAVLAYNSFVRLNRLLIQNLRHVAEQLTAYSNCDAK